MSARTGPATPPATGGRQSLESPTTHPGSDRPRLLSYVGRWGRARRWLPAEARRVVDVGCAFGYGTAALTARGTNRRWVVGVEPDAAHVAAASKVFPWLPLVRGDAGSLPLADASVDAAVMLDVLEHVADPDAVLGEIQRVVRPGGYLIVSVPHKGLLAGLDPMNVYPRLQRRFPSWLPLNDAEGSGTGTHRHFSVVELAAALGPRYVIDRVGRSGLGLSEVLYLGMLVAFKGILRREGLFRSLLPVHMFVYIIDDLIPSGRFAYHLTVRARVCDPGEARLGDSSRTNADLDLRTDIR